ncbi:MAG: hypothetical protein ACXAC7_11360 [Candidatus Hodarchaeales archaeon]
MVSDEDIIAFYNCFERVDLFFRFLIIIFLSIDCLLYILLILDHKYIYSIGLILSILFIHATIPSSCNISIVNFGKAQIEIYKYRIFPIIKQKTKSQFIDRYTLKAHLRKTGIISPTWNIILIDSYHKLVKIPFRRNFSRNLIHWVNNKYGSSIDYRNKRNYKQLVKKIPELPNKKLSELSYNHILYLGISLTLFILTGALFFL